MKQIFILSLIFSTLTLFTAKAQNNVGIGTTSPQASALLDLTATDKGFLMTRVTLVAAANGTSPINSPATGLLVYNTGGALTAGFYYWNGSMWVQVGATAAPTCVTLDGAYDCGGNGLGRSITVDNGRVEMTVPLSATNDEGLYIVTNKGTSVTPTATAWLEQNQWGVGLQVDANLAANQYSAVQGSSYTNNSSTTIFPAGIAGYCSGTGKGAGIWAEYSGTNTGGCGLYAKASGSNFGAKIYSSAYVGANIETAGGASVVALQVVSSGASYVNAASLFRGYTQMDISSNASCTSVLFNNLGGEPTIAPQAADYGLIGTASTYWYQGYAEGWFAVSRPELKRNITNIDENMSALILSDIKKINPVFYKFNNEQEQFTEGKESKTRYNMHMGLLITDAPDYLQDNTFNAIDIYALSTFTLMGVKINTEQIENVTNNVNTLSKNATISDFGFSSTGSEKEIRVNYTNDFTGQLQDNQVPVVSVTPSSPNAQYYIKSQDEKGFVIASNSDSFSFNWVAMAKIVINDVKPIDDGNINNINPDLLSQLRVSQDKKTQMKAWGLKPQLPSNQLIWSSEDGKAQNVRSERK